MRAYPLPTLETLDSRLLFGAGDLDPAFNHGALVDTEFAGGSSVIADIETLPDGGILAAGTVRVREGDTLTEKTQLALVKYCFDGSLDLNFGVGGKIVNTPRGMSGAVRLQLTPDGGFLVMGSPETSPDGLDSNDNPVVSSFASAALNTSEMLLKFTATGRIDTRFGKNGVIKPGNIDTFTVDPQGRILVGGFQNHADLPQSSFATDATLTRYTEAGALDTSFNSTGQFISVSPDIVEEESRYQTFRSIAIDNQGRILSAMEVFSTFGGDVSTDGLGYAYTQMFRLSDSGQIDGSYTGDHIQKLRRIAGVLDDGSVILIGKTIARVDPTGHLDASYGNNGVANTTKLSLTPSNNLYLRQAEERAAASVDGSIVFANVATPGHLELTRIDPQGQPDASFGNSGTLTIATDNDPDTLGYLGAVDLAPDGSIVVAGQSGILTPKTAATRDLDQNPRVTIETDTRRAVVGRVMSGAGPAVQLVPRTLKASSRSLYITVLIRDPEGVDVSTLDDYDLKLLDASHNVRRFHFIASEDRNGNGTYIAARYRIAAPGASIWTSADNGIFQVRLQRKQIADRDANWAVAQVLGPVFVKIA
jgi:uncharacterized delta-60 repeat protein